MLWLTRGSLSGSTPNNFFLKRASMCLGLYTDLADLAAQIAAGLSILPMLFFLTCYWCRLPPPVYNKMEGCPIRHTLVILGGAMHVLPLAGEEAGI